MKQIDSEQLLWELPWEEGKPTTPAPPNDETDETDEIGVTDETLRAYRGGRMGADERRDLEATLAHSPASWERLARLGNIESPEPSPELRERILDAFPQPQAEAEAQPGDAGAEVPSLAPRRAWIPLWWAAAASVALILVLAAGYRWLLPTPDAPPPHHTVQIAALEPERSTPEARRSARAYPLTPVRIRARAELAQAGLDYGLYLLSPGPALERLAVNPPQTDSAISVQTYRGAVEFEASAADLVGHLPGDYSLYVVVASAGELPPGLELEPGQDPVTTLTHLSRGRVYSVSLHVVEAFDAPDAHQQ